MHDDVNDFILLTDILGGYWHELIDDFIKQLGVTAGVISYARYKLACSLFMLYKYQTINKTLRAERETTDRPWQCPLGQ
jgi:hypothetical protein